MPTSELHAGLALLEKLKTYVVRGADALVATIRDAQTTHMHRTIQPHLILMDQYEKARPVDLITPDTYRTVHGIIMAGDPADIQFSDPRAGCCVLTFFYQASIPGFMSSHFDGVTLT